MWPIWLTIGVVLGILADRGYLKIFFGNVIKEGKKLLGNKKL